MTPQLIRARRALKEALREVHDLELLLEFAKLRRARAVRQLKEALYQPQQRKSA